MPADLLVLGHIVKDITNDGWRPGGSVAYAAAQAQALGRQVSAVTVCSDDLQPSSVVSDVEWRVASDPRTTTFENRYIDGRREQRLLVRARPLDANDLPSDWQQAPLVLFATVFHDIDPELPRLVAGPERLVGLAAQGWLRKLDGDRVRPGAFEPHPPWLTGDVVFVSEEDIDDPEAVEAWLRWLPLVVLTRSERGCTLWTRQARHDLPGYETRAVDPTGAGDAFAASFLVRLSETLDPLAAARFASTAAALAIGATGLQGIASRDAIERLAATESRATR